MQANFFAFQLLGIIPGCVIMLPAGDTFRLLWFFFAVFFFFLVLSGKLVCLFHCF